ncbi:MAG: hypothetical protein ACREXS_12100 [Gammaproteobacteria bacterium]
MATAALAEISDKQANTKLGLEKRIMPTPLFRYKKEGTGAPADALV